MERKHPSPAVDEGELHAFVDGQLPAARRREVAAHLAAHPDAADRVAAYLHQRDALARLGRRLAGEPIPARLAWIEAALLGATRPAGARPADRRRVGWGGRLVRVAAPA